MRVIILHNAVPPDAPLEDQDTLVQVEAVMAALGRLGHEPAALACTLDLAALRDELRRRRPDVVFNLVESLAEADSLVYLPLAVLDMLGLPYTGSRTESLFLTTHKLLAKERLRSAGLPTPAWVESESGEWGRHSCLPLGRQECLPHFGITSSWILKGIWDQASRGMEDDAVLEGVDVTEVRKRLEERAAGSGQPCFAEQFIEGREFNLSVLAGPKGPEVLRPAEIDFSAFPAGKPRIVGHRAKWQADSFEYHHTPRRFDFDQADVPLLDQLRSLAERCWTLFGLRGWGRVDFRVDAAGQPWILEINANPCLSPEAGFAAALEQAGIPFDEAIQRILEATNRDHRTTMADQPLAFRYEVCPDDRETVRRLVESTDVFSPVEIDVAVELVDDRLRCGQQSDYHFVFAQQGGRTVGYTCYGRIALTAASFDLYWIAVDKTMHGRRVGRLLLERTEELIREMGGRQMYVETSNRHHYAPTRGFYLRCGYHQEALLKDFYAPGDDKVIYVKGLGAEETKK